VTVAQKRAFAVARAALMCAPPSRLGEWLRLIAEDRVAEGQMSAGELRDLGHRLARAADELEREREDA